ncbi:hypothetical protein BYT27DRAFT_7179497, partial [Phlegmacium glaucopus]
MVPRPCRRIPVVAGIEMGTTDVDAVDVDATGCAGAADIDAGAAGAGMTVGMADPPVVATATYSCECERKDGWIAKPTYFRQ